MQTTNLINNNPFSDFKQYQEYLACAKSKKQPIVAKKQEEGLKQKAFIGAAIGTIAAISLSKKMPDILKIKKESILNDYLSTITMALGANIGGVVGGSIGEDKESKNKKIKEGAFQVMNITIPMTLVTMASALCKNTKALNNNVCKITGSILGMASGAFLATQITNATKKENEEKRKYSIKDATANFDDIVATIKIGFRDLAQKIPVDTILPFIYLYSGSRAGSKE